MVPFEYEGGTAISEGNAMHTLHLRGEDVGAFTYWAWEWDDEGIPEYVTVDRKVSRPVIEELDRALPGALESEASLSEGEVRAALRAAPLMPGLRERAMDEPSRELLMVHRCTSGAFAALDTEHALSASLGRLLLPIGFLATLRKRSREFGSENVEVRVLPAPSCVRVPWELLVTGDPNHPDQRLLELARIVTMAPLLGRDGDSAVPHPEWTARKDEPPLYLIDPAVGGVKRVLSAPQSDAWATRLGQHAEAAGVGVGVVHTPIGREWLSEELSRRRSRFMYIGHVVAGEETAGKTSLVLNDGFETYGLGRRTGPGGMLRYLTAQDLVAGTVGHEVNARNLSEEHNLPVVQAVQAEYGEGPLFPSRAVSPDGVVREIPGEQLWPMPPRVALIACQSGADFSHAEPFGLVTAFLELGAELVTATRWVLLTDTAFALVSRAEPLIQMAIAIDEMHQQDDPLMQLARWQRERLNAWRTSGSLADSPLTWAAVTNYHAPDRTIR